MIDVRNMHNIIAKKSQCDNYYQCFTFECLKKTFNEIMLKRNARYIEDINITNLLHQVEFPKTRWLPIIEEISR